MTDGAVESPAEVESSPIDAEAIQPGTNVLIAGPALTGKRRVAFDIVAASRSKSACLVTTKASADRTRSWFAESVGLLDEWDLTLIDCVSRSTGFGRLRPKEGVNYVTSPGDLTGIGISLSGRLADWDKGDVRDPRIMLSSLSTLLMYASLKQVYRFCYVVTGRIRLVNGVGVFTIDTNSGSREATETLQGLFDAMIELREGDDGPQVRVRGGSFGPKQWTDL